MESIKTQNNKDIAKVDKKLIKFVRSKVKIVFFFNKLVDETGSSVEDLHNIAHLFNIVFIYLFIYFISIFILLTRRKATEELIHRVGNYPDLLPEIPRYCCPLVI